MLWPERVPGGPLKLEERKVAVGDLQVGMYVCRLDRDWEGTSFPLQGVMVRSAEDVAQLARYSRFVYVDIEQGLAPGETMRAARPARRRELRHLEATDIERMRGQVAYADTVAFAEELPQAREAQRKVVEFASRMLDDVREGRPLSPDEVRDAVEPMVRSILRNADAFLWVDHLRERGSYEYNHALACSALSAAFGRHIGFPEDLLVDMASGGLLLDVGKLRVREELVARAGALTPAESREMRAHVEHGLAILDEGRVVPDHIREMVRGHHERDNGSGYPDGLPSDRIPLLARIAGVIDAYDAMTSARRYRAPVSRHAALQELYRERDRLFAAEIVEQFMQCMSVYPTGSLVELSSGEVAIVMRQNLARRLRPTVMVLTGPDKALLPAFRSFDLMAQSEQGEAVLIAGTLEPGAYGLDPAELYL